MIKLIKNLEKLLPPSFYKYFLDLLYYFQYAIWLVRGKPIPPPHIVKMKTIKSYANEKGISTLIETGTYLGDTINYLKESFDRIYSIELDKKLFNNAKDKFINDKNVYLINGDSGKEIKNLLMKINTSTIFWLDAHYSGKGTAKAELDTPIMRELNAILRHKIKDHVILIDDARLFNGKNDYPELNWLEDYIRERHPQLDIEVENDIIRIF